MKKLPGSYTEVNAYFVSFDNCFNELWLFTFNIVVLWSVFVDLTPINVVAKVLGPSRILVKWDPPLHADSSIKGYKVYKRWYELISNV